jgi:hypothetical protein
MAGRRNGGTAENSLPVSSDPDSVASTEAHKSFPGSVIHPAVPPSRRPAL